MPDPEKTETTKSGLPILKKGGAATDNGLPILKKKEETSGLAVSPSGSLETNQKQEKSSTPSESATPSKEEVSNSIFGASDKKIKTVNPEDVADEKGSLLNTAEQKLDKGADEAGKAKVHERVVNFRNNFFTGTLTPEDISLVPGELNGVSEKDAATAINNKTKNLRVWGNIAMMKGIQNASDQLKDIDKQIDQLKGQKGASTFLNKYKDPNADAEIKNLENRKAFLNNSITQVYNAESDKVAKDIIQVLKPSLGSRKTAFGDFNGPIKYDPYTNTLTEKSEFYIRKQVDDYLNVHHNDVVNYKTSGDTEDGKRNYPNEANKVINYFNTVIPVQKAHDQVDKDVIAKYPAAKGLIDHIQSLNESFSQENEQKVDAAVKTTQDKGFLGVNNKYLGPNGLISSTPEFQTIQKKWQEAVKNKEVPEDVALNQMQVEVSQNKGLKKLYDNYSKDVTQVQEGARKMRETYIINSLKKIDPSLTMYKNGNVGIEGLTQAQSKEIIDYRNDEMVKATAKTLHDQHEKLGLRADEKAKRLGGLWASFSDELDGMQTAFSKMLFDKTQWGGQSVEMYQAKRSANIPMTQSDEARKWNWQSVRSLADPNFYGSSVGPYIPIIAGAAAVTAATKGAGMPEYVGWIATAGLIDATSSVEQYNDIALNGTDKFGNKLTQHDASVAAADNFKRAIVPDVAMVALNLGILSKAKNIVKPTLLKAIASGAKGAVVGALPMAWQGWAQYASQMEAEGKTPDLYDFAMDGKLAHSLFQGLAFGAGLQLFHVPDNYIKQTENFKRMILSTNAGSEFHNNIMFNAALNHEIIGKGGQWRDNLLLKIGTEPMSEAQKEDNKNTLLYSTSLEKNIKGGGIDVSNVNGAYQAHSLALADVHDHWAKMNEDNPSLAKIYSEQAGEFRKQAKAVMEGKGKFHYLTDVTDQPIFISDQSFKTLDADGKIADWIKTGTINGIHSSDDPNFDKEYKEKIKQDKSPDVESTPPIEPAVENEDQKIIINALKDHQGDITGAFKLMVDGNIEDPKKHEDLTKGIISQAIYHPTLAKEMLGKEAWKKIEPFVIEQKKIAEAEAKARDFENAKKESNQKVVDQKIEGIDQSRKARAEINFEGKKMRTDAAIDKLKDRHAVLEDILNNCL